MTLINCHGVGRSYVNAILYDFSSPRVSTLVCIMLRHKAIEMNGDLVTWAETNYIQIVVISKRLKAKGAMN